MSRFIFFITETVTSFRRHPTMAFAAITCVAAALFAVGLVGLSMLNIHHAVKSAEGKVRFKVFYRKDATRDEALRTNERIQLLSNVESVEFVSKETAWAQMTEGRGMNDLPMLIEKNPLPDGSVVKPRDIRNIPALVAVIEKWPGVEKVRYVEQVSTALENISAGLGRVGLIAGIILAVLSLVIIHHTIELTLYARRREIFIMSLVGATPATIAMPFLLEGIAYGLVGAGVALGFVSALYKYVSNSLLQSFNAHLLDDPAVLTQGVIALLIGGLVLGLFGSLVSVIKFLNRPRSKVTNA
ncbi:MAG: cell division protein FtsX [Armatimonadota bacterium]